MQPENIIRTVERAAYELRTGGVVRVNDGDDFIDIKSLESSDISSCDTLVISGLRAHYVADRDRDVIAYKCDLTGLLKSQGQKIAGVDLGKISNGVLNFLKNNLEPVSGLSECALRLCKIAELLPAVALCNGEGRLSPIIVELEAIEAYEECSAKNLEKIFTAPLTLEGAKQALITVFRTKWSTKEHYAVTVGSPKVEEAVLVRIHSCCFTGDVLASLKCDCREQLQEALADMSKEGSGILLYLMQEGRGIGLTNKLRTYELQERGLDTVEANEYLGFGGDERPFLVAARMLESLDVQNVRLMTNNPRKIKGLEDCGLKVERVDHMVSAHEHNKNYLDTKFSKLGHIK